MQRLPILVVLVVSLGMVTVGGYAVAQDMTATPEVVHPGTPEILPGLCATVVGIATPVDLTTGTPGVATPADLTTGTPGAREATPALFPCATPEGSPAAAGG